MYKARVGPFEWYHIYYILAAFDILTILASIGLNHVLTEQYNESVNNNRAWAMRHSDFSQLARLSAELNAPGNDVFHSQNVPQERLRLALRMKNFERKMKEIDAEFAKEDLLKNYPQLKKDLDNARGPLKEMIAEEQKVLDLVEAKQLEEASHHMAIMDKQYLFATKSLIRIRLRFSEIQQSLLYQQAQEVDQMRIFERIIAVAVVLMICGITYYGNRLARQAQSEAREKEKHIAEIELARTNLENKKVQLETALDQLNEAQSTVIQSERKFHAIFDHTFQLIGLMQVDGVLLEANETSLKMIGVDKSAVVGKYFWQTPWWSHDLEMQEQLKDAVIKAGQGEFVRFETTHKNADGLVVNIDFSLKPVFDESGKVVMLIPEGRDISDKKLAEQRVSDFYSTVSHELRTPLTAVRGSLGLIEGGLAGDITEKTKMLVEIASVECDRLIRLINDILDLRKIEAGMLELRKEQNSAEALVSQTVTNLAAIAEESKVALNVHAEYQGKVFCDEDRTIQILTNLISNAIKFSNAGSSVDIFVDSKNGSGMVRFTVKDNGPGIAPQEKENLFGRFQQANHGGDGKKGGTGLGLAISKALVEQHGGVIGMESEIGRGSSFWFELAAEDDSQNT